MKQVFILDAVYKLAKLIAWLNTVNVHDKPVYKVTVEEIKKADRQKNGH